MIRSLDRADADSIGSFAEIIDVRSPSEFQTDHIPGAINLPVLNDAERARVGTIYVQQSRFEARRVGAAIVARNVANHLDGALSGKAADFAPLVYCWRGGQRSRAMATILDQIGWRPTLLDGGYRTYRRSISRALNEGEATWRVVLLGGNTGTAKTAILERARQRGAQVIDLEGLAEHRGSLLGGFTDRVQPAQKMFETRLAEALRFIDPSRPVLIEAESSKVGSINLPAKLWKAMRHAPMIEVRAPVRARARYLVSAYADLIEDRSRLEGAVSRLPGRHGREKLDAWRLLASSGAFAQLAEDLIEMHYDPAYKRWSRQHCRVVLQVIELEDLSDRNQTSAAAEITRLVSKI